MSPKPSRNLERIRKVVVEAYGHPTFRAGKKMFAAYGEGGEEGASPTETDRP